MMCVMSHLGLTIALPEGFGGAPYDMSGWCHIEAAISTLIKPKSARLDLSKRSSSSFLYSSLARACTAARMPPQAPDAVAWSLEHEKKFTNKGDVEVVAGLYRRFFEAVAPAVEEVVEVAKKKGRRGKS